MYEFPKDFLWGAGTSAYQVEGNNTNSDWWEWEKKALLQDRSGLACRHYELFNEDFDLARSLNHNAHRLSIEWSRIQPTADSFSDNELNHYRKVILALRERKIEPVVTLHHFTNPLWFTQAGGWEQETAARDFTRYISDVVESLGDLVRFWITINEPLVYVYHSYLKGSWPPQVQSLARAKKVAGNLALAHEQAYHRIKNIYRHKDWSASNISIAKNIRYFMPCNLNPLNIISRYIRDKEFNFNFLDRIIRSGTLDFIGINYYSRELVDVAGWSTKNILLDTCSKNHHPVAKNSLGWDIYPQGLYKLLLRLKSYNLPLFILENGICTDDDNQRRDFIREHLLQVAKARDQGVKIIGYLYWSLLDNFEWDKGFAPRFGLTEVDYKSYARTVRESARYFAQICKTGQLV